MKKSTKKFARKLKTEQSIAKRKAATINRLSMTLESDMCSTTRDGTYQECAEQLGWNTSYQPINY